MRLAVGGRLHNEDLAQALRRLTALGWQANFESEGDGLEAAFTPEAAALRDPLDGRPIGRVRLRVAADGRVRIQAPTLLASARERSWRQLPALAALCAELQAGLDKAHVEAEAICRELAGRGLEAEIDPESRLPSFALELEAGRAVHFECAGDRAFARTLHAAGRAACRLHDLSFAIASLPGRVDFVLQVADALERGRHASGTAPTETRASARGFELGALLEALGPHWTLSAGATLSGETTIHGDSARLELTLAASGPLVLRLIGAQGELWSRPLERGALAQWERLAARSAPARQAHARSVPEAPRWGEREEQLARGLLPPAVNETWVMEVRVESDDGREVRYRGVNVGGDDYGAPRVLRKDWFEETFAPAGRGWRMRVRIVEVDEASVLYERLSARREGAGTQRRIPLIIFLASFVPEAGDY